MNSVDRLVYMANQISANLATDDDPVTAITNHIELFWDPRMKKLIREYKGDGLSSDAAAAISRLVEIQNAA